MKVCPICSRTYADEMEFCTDDATRLTAQVNGTEAQLATGLARRFRIVRQLGAGGMGAVFLAEQIAVGNRPVALKVLLHTLLENPDFLHRFQDEAASTGRIHHPNVVTIYESGQAGDGTPYIAMEFLEGESLRDVLKKRGALPLVECADILQQTAHGLNAAHKLGIIHRDLKPDNIFLTQGDEGELVVKVVDFGIAKLRESATHTMTGMVLGTPAYMSSEQARGMRSNQLDLRSDVYSLGVVVYEILTGRVPFHSDTPLGYLQKHMMEAPPPFRAVAPGLPIPPQVEEVVMKALVKDRDQRYASALEFSREFSRAASTQSLSEPLQPTVKVVESPGGMQAEQERQARERAEAERREKERAGAELRSALAAPPEPRPTEVGAVREPPLREQGAGPQREKKPRVVMASLVAAVVVLIVAALFWVYWPSPNHPPGPQPSAPQPETSVPGKPETPVQAPAVNDRQTNLPSPPSKPAQIVVDASPNAQVYLDDTFKGQVSRQGRLVIEDPKPGDHSLRVSLTGKKDYEQQVTVTAGQVAPITAILRDAEQPSPPAPVETPRRAVFAPGARTVRENSKDRLKYVLIPPGKFGMGCSPGDNECDNEEKPSHRVTISKGFWIAQTDVTVGAYKRFVGSLGRPMPPAPGFNNGWANDNMPMVGVSWEDAQSYCEWMGGRLPTEAEWEYAARGDSTEARYGPIDEVAWYNGNSGNQTHDVAQKRPNGFGLYDMLGNVWQWVDDWHDPNYYQKSPSQDPSGPPSGQLRVFRGGSWNAIPRNVRVSHRDGGNPGDGYNNNGFRCAEEVGNP